MKKVVFIGGGYAALIAARALAQNGGFDVTIFEQKAKNEVYYAWRDDISQKVFEELGIELPPRETYEYKENWTIITPNKVASIPINQPEDDINISVLRREMYKYLLSLMPENVQFRYGEQVKSLIITEKGVVGVELNNEKVYADLVVDCSGITTDFRIKAGLEPATPREIIYTYRAFYELKEGEQPPKCTHKVYFKYEDIPGIVWCNYDHDKRMDVLIGASGGLSMEYVNNILSSVRKDNPALSDKVLLEGKIIPIPFRYPMTKLFTKGYVCLGDSGYMTIPLLASGIASSMSAAKYLSDVLIEGGENCMEEQNLWQYQVRCYQKFGGTHLSVDVLKRFLLGMPPKNLDFLISKRVINEKDLEAGASGNGLTMTMKDILDKLVKGFTKISVLLSLATAASKSDKAKQIGEQIPTSYDQELIEAWQQKVRKLFK